MQTKSFLKNWLFAKLANGKIVINFSKFTSINKQCYQSQSGD